MRLLPRAVPFVLITVAIACADQVTGPRAPQAPQHAFDDPWAQCSQWVTAQYQNDMCGVSLSVFPTTVTNSDFLVQNLNPWPDRRTPPPLVPVQVTLSRPVRRLDIWYTTAPYSVAWEAPMECPAPGRVVVHVQGGADRDVTPEGFENGCDAYITVRADEGIVGLTFEPTPDAPRLERCWSYPCDGGYLDRYEAQSSSIYFGWDLPPDSLCPPTGKGLLDYKPFRDSLWVALQRSNITGPNHERREVTGEVVVKRVTGDTIVRWPSSLNPKYASPCTVGPTWTLESGYDLIARFHTHPFEPGTPTAADTLCGWTNGGEVRKMASGFSSPDFKAMAKADSIARALGDTTEALNFFINKRDVHWIPMRTKEEQQKSKTQSHQWKMKGCRFFEAQP